MQIVLRIVLVFCLTLTGVGLGIARGMVQSDGQVVICTGEGVVIRHVPGAPGKAKAHICPDMALSLLSAPAMPDVFILRDAVQYQLFTSIESVGAKSWLTPIATARDPPRRPLTV